MIKQRKCVYDTSSMSQEPVKVCVRSLAYHVNRYRNCHFYRLSITTEKFGYSPSRKAYRDRNTPWNTCEMTLSTIVGLKGKKLKKTDKQTKRMKHQRGNVIKQYIKQPIHVINLLTQLLLQRIK